MDFALEAEGIDLDPWLEQYVRSTVVFAIWRHDAKVERVDVTLDRVLDAGGEPYVRCALELVTMASTFVSSGSTGRGVCEAVQGAADLLEVALYERLSEAWRVPLRQLAA